MSSEFGLPSTGLEIVDEIRGLQLVADTIDETAKKLDRVRFGLGLIAARELLDRPFMITAAQVLGNDPNTPPDDLVIFNHGMLFIGQLDSMEYLINDQVPIDCLSLKFLNPEVFDADEYDAPLFRGFTFQVPVLAIESCLAADAA